MVFDALSTMFESIIELLAVNFTIFFLLFNDFFFTF